MRIHFEDHGQDFLTWQLDNNGIVVDSSPFQADLWCGVEVDKPGMLKVGGLVSCRHPNYVLTTTLRYPIAAIEPDMTAEAFTAKYPVGTACRYYPIAGSAKHRKTKTRSEAWALGHGAVIVKIEGSTGGVDINHLVMEPAP
ncbi:hypothetical protein ACFPPA_05790 [Rhodanobacter ginsengisoli]|uniref:Uncharacterized protein n=1 Tax=Rhodanobacter ginsengisoli TaxID=418646 RepID=A0ABW0QKX0_9GAMM